MSSVPPFDTSDYPPEWVGDPAQFDHVGNRLKGYVTAWSKAFTKAETNVNDFDADPSDELRDLANASFDRMEVAFIAMSNMYEAAVYLAGEDPDLMEKASKMMWKFAGYDKKRDDLERVLKTGYKKLNAAKDLAASKARDDAAKASLKAAISAQASSSATAAAATATPTISAVYCEALKPKTQLSTECRPEVYQEWKSSIKAWMEMSGFDKGSFETRTELVKKCLSTEFAVQIKPFLTDGADPTGPHGIFEVIDQAYQRAYPLFAKDHQEDHDLRGRRRLLRQVHGHAEGG